MLLYNRNPPLKFKLTSMGTVLVKQRRTLHAVFEVCDEWVAHEGGDETDNGQSLSETHAVREHTSIAADHICHIIEFLLMFLHTCLAAVPVLME